MAGPLKVLAIGSLQISERVRDALLPRRHFSLLVVSDYWSLCLLSQKEAQLVSIAILEVSHLDRDLRRKAECVRRRWPGAQIILLASRAGALEDQLYDERIQPGFHHQELLGLIDRLLKHRRRAKQMTARQKARFDLRRTDQYA